MPSTSGIRDAFQLKGFDTVFDATLNNEIQDNIIEWLDWTLLEKGIYFNVTANELAPNGSDYSRLRLSSDERYTAGQVWEGFRSKWVWQSGVSYSPSPITGTDNMRPGISGVYVDGAFYGSDTEGAYSHYVDYHNGKVIFDSPIPSGSTVNAEFSYKWIHVIYSNSIPWLRDVQYRSYDINSDFLQAGKGKWDELPETEIQLPAIGVEIVPRRTFRGYQLGGGQVVNTDVLFHCIAEDDNTRNKLVDIISMQNDKTIWKFDSNTMAASGDFPIDYRGTPVSGALMYPDLARKHFGGHIRLHNSSVQGIDMINSNLYGGIVRLTTEVIRTSI